LANLLHDRYLNIVASGGGNLDWSAISGLAAKDAGLIPNVHSQTE
jgi:hypothetical protein